MNPPTKASLDLALTSEQLGELRRLMVRSLVMRGYPHTDAEDAAHDFLENLVRNPDPAIIEKVKDLEQNGGYFVVTAQRRMLMRLRSERRRRDREVVHAAVTGVPVPGEEDADDGDIERLLRTPGLTSTQRQYLELVLLRRMTIQEIADVMGTTSRAVRAVLQRAAGVIRSYVQRHHD